MKKLTNLLLTLFILLTFTTDILQVIQVALAWVVISISARIHRWFGVVVAILIVVVKVVMMMDGGVVNYEVFA